VVMASQVHTIARAQFIICQLFHNKTVQKQNNKQPQPHQNLCESR
jgi:hypothetical protein